MHPVPRMPRMPSHTREVSKLVQPVCPHRPACMCACAPRAAGWRKGGAQEAGGGVQTMNRNGGKWYDPLLLVPRGMLSSILSLGATWWHRVNHLDALGGACHRYMCKNHAGSWYENSSGSDTPPASGWRADGHGASDPAPTIMMIATADFRLDALSGAIEAAKALGVETAEVRTPCHQPPSHAIVCHALHPPTLKALDGYRAHPRRALVWHRRRDGCKSCGWSRQPLSSPPPSPPPTPPRLLGFPPPIPSK